MSIKAKNLELIENGWYIENTKIRNMKEDNN